MKLKLLNGLLFAVFFISCNENGDIPFYNSKANLDCELVFINSISVCNEHSNYIERIGKIGQFKDGYYITDYSAMKINIYNEQFNYIKSVGREGRGPGEFRYPMVVRGAENLWVMDISNHQLSKFDQNFNYVTSKQLPSFAFLYSEPLKFEDKLIFSAEHPVDVTRDSYYKDYKSLIGCDMDLEYIGDAMEWNNVYLDDNYKGAARCGTKTYTTLGPDNTFFAIQQSSYLISIINSDLSTKMNFGVKPRNYRPLVKGINFHEVQTSRESIVEMGSKESHIKNICYDKESKLLIVSFNNPKKEAYNKRNNDYIEKYIIVYDENFNCILETKVDGVFLFSKNEELYFLYEEADKSITINKYKI